MPAGSKAHGAMFARGALPSENPFFSVPSTRNLPGVNIDPELGLTVAGDVQGRLGPIRNHLPWLHFEAAVSQELDGDDLRLEDGHVHAETDPGAGLEDRKLMWWRHLKRDPSLWTESHRLRIATCVPAHDVGAINNLRPCRDFPTTRQHVVLERHLRVKWDWGPKSEGFVDDAVEVRHLAGCEVCHLQWNTFRGLRHDFFVQASLDCWVLGKLAHHPRQKPCSGVPSSNNKVQHHLPHKVGIETGLDKKC
mmetsp:Transcript_55386/g.129201  ORF Transcript_55386/g.129201 Transcript_55386/m.129201 type:complete len:250 (+) Transcript_55386:105-854(+)